LIKKLATITMKAKRTIGRVDKIDFLEFDLQQIACKIDTGAATSSIHCQHVHIVEEKGKKKLAFSLLDKEHPNYDNKVYFTDNFSEKKVKSSTGHSELRFVIETKVVLFGETYTTQFTLADREQMRYPVLIGRKLLRGNFIVDVARTNLSAKKK